MMRKVLVVWGICVMLVACGKGTGDTNITTIAQEQTTTMTEAEIITEPETITNAEPMLVDALWTKEFCEEELTEILRLIGDEEMYQKYFVDTINVSKNWGGGFECEIAGGTTARIYATGDEVDEEHSFFIIIGDDGSIYMKFGTEKIGFKSNVEGATEIPRYAIF